MLTVTCAQCHIKAPYAECCYYECRYTECRGAKPELLIHYKLIMINPIAVAPYHESV